MPSSPARNRAAFDWNLALMGGVFVVAAASQVKVMAFDAPAIQEKARNSKRFETVKTILARQGSLLTADGKPLARDHDRYELILEPENAPRTPAFYTALGRALGLPPSEIQSSMESGKKRAIWRLRLTEGQRSAFWATKSDYRADGIGIQYVGGREYPLGEAAAVLVGVDRGVLALKDEEGNPVKKHIRTGLEGALHGAMEGTDGSMRGMRDHKGRLLPMRSEEVVAKRDGDDVILTIEADLQREAYQALRDQVRAFRAERATAVVLNPRTGDVLALANYPSFDPTRAGVRTVDQNAAVGVQLDPGSVFKPITLAIALQEGKVDPKTIGVCNGVGEFGGIPLKCDFHNGRRAHGPVDAYGAMAKSCNIMAARWATAVGRDRYLEYLEKLGLLRPQGSGIPGEVGGYVYRNDPAPLIQVSRWGMGQAITVTPLGLATALCPIANGGQIVRPRLVLEKEGASVPARVGERVFTAEAAAETRKAMQAVMEAPGGTGTKIKLVGYELAGKTGTAQRYNVEGGGYGDGNNSNFVGMVPADDPEAVIVVMVEKAKVQQYGGLVAGPAFQRIAEAVVKRYRIPPTRPVP